MNNYTIIRQDMIDLSIGIPMIIIICMHCVGIYLHVKIIKISRTDKQITWKLNITNSCMLMAHHTHCILMDVITYTVPNLYIYTGEWLCYTSKVVMYYGNIYATTHSMIVSMLKYILIVHWQKARNMGHEMIEVIFFWINLLYPAFQILIFLMVIPDFFVKDAPFLSFARIDRCLGYPENVLVPNSNKTKMTMHNLCQELYEPSHEYPFAYAIHILKSSICWIQVIALDLISFNFLEMLIYCRIFSFVRR